MKRCCARIMRINLLYLVTIYSSSMQYVVRYISLTIIIVSTKINFASSILTECTYS